MFGLGQRRPVVDRLHVALDALSANVMIADAGLNIVFMNQAVRSLMQEAEAELRRELPRFSVATLIGSNIDVFHKNPQHQRGMLRRMEAPHQATIRVGSRIFDLLVTPLPEAGEIIGYARRMGRQPRAAAEPRLREQIRALGRSQAIVQFTPDGTIVDANDKFLATMGYTLDEIRGRPHGIFVDPAEAAGAEYRAFWDRLRAGDYQQAQFRRLGKGGREVWVEGAYNPIRDVDGKVCKVVKFCTDTTAQMTLLARLQAEVAAVDTAVESSNRIAPGASATAEQMGVSMQGVATQSDALATSFAEIADSMGRAAPPPKPRFDQTATMAEGSQARPMPPRR